MKKFSTMRVLIAIFVVILGMGAIGWFTWHLGKMFVGLVSKSPAPVQETATVATSEVLSLPEIKVWTCQIGVFKDEKNARALIDSLKAKGWKAGIVKEDPYTVSIGLFGTKEKAAELGNVLAESGTNTWIKEESFPALHYKVSGKNVEKVCLNLKIANALLTGGMREQVRQELAGDSEFLFSGGYPTDFQKLNHDLEVIFNTDYEKQGFTGAYEQDMLEVYLEYRSIATKYLKNSK